MSLSASMDLPKSAAQSDFFHGHSQIETGAMTDENFLERHKRHLMLKEIGGPGVQKLAAGSVSIIGAGALGGPCAMYLAAAGVGTIEIWDDDVVDRSNLQRQIQFGEADIGRAKTDVLAERLVRQNSSIQIITQNQRFSSAHSPTGDVLIDASDNFATRYALNEAAHGGNKFLIHGAAAGWAGQSAVFSSGIIKDAPCYQCWVPETPPDAEGCDEIGVAGPMTGMVATQMAVSAMLCIIDPSRVRHSQLYLFDGLSGLHRQLQLRKDTACSICN